MRRGRRCLAPSANFHVKTAQRKALLGMTSAGPRQGYLQFCGSWVVAAPPCSNFTLWSWGKGRKQERLQICDTLQNLPGDYDYLWFLWGVDTGVLCLSPHWFLLQSLSEIYTASSGLIKYNFLTLLARHSRCTSTLSAGSQCRQHWNSSWRGSPSAAPTAAQGTFPEPGERHQMAVICLQCKLNCLKSSYVFQ